MEEKKTGNSVQQNVVRLAARMASLFMPCDGAVMIMGYAAILVLEKAIREDMPPTAVSLAREIAGTIKAEMEDK